MLQVRSRAQVKLFAALDQFSYSYRVLIPHLVSHLQQDSSQFHEQFKVGLNSASDSVRTSILLLLKAHSCNILLWVQYCHNLKLGSPFDEGKLL
jgi:hypothetical protein